MTEQQALESVVRAWEQLREGRHDPRTIERWLRDTMWHAINDAREALGRERSDGRKG